MVCRRFDKIPQFRVKCSLFKAIFKFHPRLPSDPRFCHPFCISAVVHFNDISGIFSGQENNERISSTTEMAALGARSLVMLIGAGYTGSYMYNNLSFERARKIATDILVRYRDADADGTNDSSSSPSSQSGGNPARAAVDALSNQVDRLTREMSRSRDQVLIVGGGPSGYKSSIATVTDVFNLLGWAVFVLSMGGVVYFVAFRKRLSLRDLLWVSQTKFNDTVNAMQTGLSSVGGVVNSVRKDLGERLRKMEGKVDDVEANLSRQIESEVGDVKDGVTKLGDDISIVSRGVDHVHVRIDEMNEKIDGTNRGVQMLIEFVSSIAPEKIGGGSQFQNIRKMLSQRTSRGEIEENSAAVRPRLSQGLALLTPNSKADDATPSSLPNGDSSRRSSLDVSSSVWSTG